jgi:hypothetical protein
MNIANNMFTKSEILEIGETDIIIDVYKVY